MSGDRVNAREELLCHVLASISEDTEIKAIRIHYFSRTMSYNMGDNWADFLASLDFIYDAGYGGQELYGTIWYTDGTWSERGEYDGSEWWEYKKCPEIV